jgi:Leucine-rich repeat (LRR) protein
MRSFASKVIRALVASTSEVGFLHRQQKQQHLLPVVVLGVRRHRSSSSSASSSSNSSSSGKEEVVSGGVDVVAKSLAELNRLKGTATKLHLVSSEDIVCRDIQCERVTGPCACKLAVALEKSGQNLREIDLSGNDLDSVPESLFEKCANLERLSLRNNKLTVEAIGKHYKLRKLKLLELGGNPGMELSVECYNRLAKRNVKVRV